MTVSGVAAIGAPLTGATVSMKCAANTIADTITDAATGAWSNTVPANSFPCVAKAVSGSGAATIELHSMTAGASGGGAVRMNITSLTQLMFARLAGSGLTPTQFYQQLGTSGSGAPVFSSSTAASIDAAFAAVRDSLPDDIKAPLAAMTGNNPVNVAFTADSSGHDKVLDDLRAALVAGNLSLSQAGAQIAQQAGLATPIMPYVPAANKTAALGSTLVIDLAGKPMIADASVTVKFGSVATATGTVNPGGTSVSVTVPGSVPVTGLPIAVAIDGAYGSILVTAIAASSGGSEGGSGDVVRKPLLLRAPISFSDSFYSATAAEIAEMNGYTVNGTMTSDNSVCTLTINNGTLTLNALGNTYSASFSGDYQDAIINNMGNGSPVMTLQAVDGIAPGMKTVSITLGANSIVTYSVPGALYNPSCKLPASPTMPANLSAKTVPDKSWLVNKAKIISGSAYVGRGKRTGGSGSESCSVTIGEDALSITVGSAPQVSVPLYTLPDGTFDSVTAGSGSAWLPYFVGPMQAVQAPAIIFQNYRKNTAADVTAGSALRAEVRYYYAQNGGTDVTGVGQVYVARQTAVNGPLNDDYVCVIKQAAGGVDWVAQ